MRIAQKLTLGFSTVLLLVLAIGIICLYQLKEVAKPLSTDIPEIIRAVDEQSRLHSLAQFVRYYDEVLTQSARNYAFTQDKKWEHRYRDAEPKLGKIIKEIIAKENVIQDKGLFSSIDKANLALVEMEYKSIELVNDGKAQEAVRVLQSKEYWDQKKIYEQGLINYVHGEGAEYDQALSVSTEKIGLADRQARNLIKTSEPLVLIFVALVFVLLTGVGCLIFYSIATPIAKLKAAAVEIGHGRLDTRIEIDSKDEMGQLAGCFSKMAEDLRKTTTSINKLNEEIAERKLAEESLWTSEERYRNLFESMDEGFALCEMIYDEANKPVDFRYIEVNPAFARQTGLPVEQVLGRTVKELIPDIEPFWIESYDRVVQGGRSERFNHAVAELGKQYEVYAWRSGIGRFAVVFSDITERKQAEDAILKAKNEWEDTFNSISDIVTIHDLDFNIVRVNKAAETTFGLAAQSLIRKKCYQIYHRKERPPENCPSRQVVKTGIPVTSEFYEPALNCHVEIKAYPRFDEKNNIIGIVHIVRDTTERKRAEEKQSELLKRIENVNGELKEFAYVVSHDLKAPLRGIKTLVSWFASDYGDKVDENGKEQLRLLSSRVDRMHNLIDGVLQYSRIGRTEEQAVKVDLNEIVAEAIDIVAAPQNITITVENNLPEVLCERTRITQVFQNLLSNAIKFMDKPQGLVKIRCEDQNDFWKFSVADNGPGIEEKHFEQIFKIFQTLSSKDDYESTGIGLTLVKKIVELYGGAIRVESKVGQGSTFYFTLPKLKAGVLDAKELAHAVS